GSPTSLGFLQNRTNVGGLVATWVIYADFAGFPLRMGRALRARASWRNRFTWPVGTRRANDSSARSRCGKIRMTILGSRAETKRTVAHARNGNRRFNSAL